MSSKKASATSWQASELAKWLTILLLLVGAGYGAYYLFGYWKRQALYKQNVVLAQALDEYQKAQQGYLGSWETLREIAQTGAQEQQGTIVEPYLEMLAVQAKQHIGAYTSLAEPLEEIQMAQGGGHESSAMRDLLAISQALAGLDYGVGPGGAGSYPLETLESFFERLQRNEQHSEHYFDDYASYMLAYYWYSQGDIERAKQIWAGIAATVQEGSEPSVWQRLSQSFIT